MKKFTSLLVVVILVMTTTALWGQTKSDKSWRVLEENDSLVIELLPINSVKDDYSPIFIDGILYFTSSRKNRHTDEAALQYNENIYTSRYVDGMWSKPKKFYFFNSDDYTALAGFSLNGPQLFSYKTFGNGDLYTSLRGEKHWYKPKWMKQAVNSSAHEQSVTEANDMMIISRERPESPGQHDLYWAIANDDQYLDFVPLIVANTEGDEVDVSFSSDGNTLYFSSSVGGNSGGYDIMYLTLDTNRQWSKPQELFVNTPHDDRWFMDCDSMFFLTSSRPGGSGGDDIYWGHIVPKYIEKDTSILVQIDTLEAKTIEIDTALIVEILEVEIVHIEYIKTDTILTVVNERTTEQLFFIPPDETPDTFKQQKFLSLYDKLDSLQFKIYTAKVQVGAYQFITSIDEFKRNFQSFDTTVLVIEKETTDRGSIIYKYLIDKSFSKLADAVVRQQEAIYQQTADVNKSYYPKGKPYDAFIVAYNEHGNRIIIYFNVGNNDYRILLGDKVIFF